MGPAAVDAEHAAAKNTMIQPRLKPTLKTNIGGQMQ